ncbi:MAG: hypothetical protein WBQ34_14345 [Candidatus Acidiferrales bacterium]
MNTNRSTDLFRKIIWVQPGTAGDVLEITDINGNVLFSEKASVADQDVELWGAKNGGPYPFKQGKWILSTLGSGKVLLYR